MKSKLIEVRFGVTINLGDYESVRLEVSEQAEVGAGDNPDEVYDEIRDAVADRLRREIRIVKRGSDWTSGEDR